MDKIFKIFLTIAVFLEYLKLQYESLALNSLLITFYLLLRIHAFKKVVKSKFTQFIIYLDPDLGIERGIEVKAPSSTKLTSVSRVASNSREHPQETAVPSDLLRLDFA